MQHRGGSDVDWFRFSTMAGVTYTIAIRAAVGGSVCWIEGHATPFGIYRRLWQTRNHPW